MSTTPHFSERGDRVVKKSKFKGKPKLKGALKTFSQKGFQYRGNLKFKG